MSDIPIPVDLDNEAYDAFAAAWQQRAPGPSARISGDPDPTLPTDGDGGDEILDPPPVDSPPAADASATDPVSTTPPSPDSAPASDTPAPPTSVTIGGRDYDIATVEQYLNIVNRLSALPIEQCQAIDHLVSTGQFPTTPSSTQTPPAPVEPNLDEYMDPRAAADIAALRTQLNTLQASQAEAARVSNASDMDRATTSVNAAISEFGAKRGLTPEECNTLANEAARLQIGPALLDSHRGDYHASTLEALEVAMYHLPQFRAKMIAAEVSTAVTAAISEQSTRESRKAKAGALAGSPTGSVPRDTPAPRPANRQEQIDAIAAVIREAQSNGVPS